MAAADLNGKPENYVVIINDGSEPYQLIQAVEHLSSSKSHIQIVAPDDSASTILRNRNYDSVNLTPLSSSSLQTVIGGLKGKIDGNDRLVVIIQGKAGSSSQSPLKTCINIVGDQCYSIDRLDTQIKSLSYGSLLVVAHYSYFSDSYNSFNMKRPDPTEPRFQRRVLFDSQNWSSSYFVKASIDYLLKDSFFHEDLSYYLSELNSNDPIKLKETLKTLLDRENPTQEADTQALVKLMTDILINPAFPPNIKALATQKLGQYGKLASSALIEIEKLIAFNDLKDKKNFIRVTALDAFSKIFSANPEAIPVERRTALLEQVKEKIKSESPSMQTTAAQAYARLVIAWNNPVDIHALKAFLLDPSQNEPIRRSAIEALSDADEKILLEINIELIMKSDNEAVTYKALENLEQYLGKNSIKREEIFSKYSTLFTPLTNRLIVLLDETISKSDETRELVVKILFCMGARADEALPKLLLVSNHDKSSSVKEAAKSAILSIRLRSQEAKQASKQGK